MNTYFFKIPGLSIHIQYPFPSSNTIPILLLQCYLNDKSTSSTPCQTNNAEAKFRVTKSTTFRPLKHRNVKYVILLIGTSSHSSSSTKTLFGVTELSSIIRWKLSLATHQKWMWSKYLSFMWRFEKEKKKKKKNLWIIYLCIHLFEYLLLEEAPQTYFLERKGLQGKIRICCRSIYSLSSVSKSKGGPVFL